MKTKILSAVLSQTLTSFKVLFKRQKGCPTNLELANYIGMSNEATRLNLMKLVKGKYIKINKKLKNRKFFI